MYINFQAVEKASLSPIDVINLQLFAQNQKDKLGELIDRTILPEIIEGYKESGLITVIKPKNKTELPSDCIRLSKKGKDLLEELQTAPIEEQDEVIFLWLAELYKNKGKTVGNGARTKRLLRDFRIASGIQKNNLIYLFLDFINDEDNMQYNNVLEYALFKPLTAFQTRFQLEDSRLYKHYLKYRARIESKFESYE